MTIVIAGLARPLRPRIGDGVRLGLEAGLAAVRERVHEELWGAESVLDVGCGTGLLRAAAGSVDWTGIDQDARSIEVAKTRAWARDDRFVVGDATALPFTDGAFDRVLCHGLLHHLDDRDAALALAEMARVCRGRAVVMDLVTDEAPVYRRVLYGLDDGRWIRSKAALTALVQGAFAVQKVTTFRSGVNLKALLMGPPR